MTSTSTSRWRLRTISLSPYQELAAGQWTRSQQRIEHVAEHAFRRTARADTRKRTIRNSQQVAAGKASRSVSRGWNEAETFHQHITRLRLYGLAALGVPIELHSVPERFQQHLLETAQQQIYGLRTILHGTEAPARRGEGAGYRFVLADQAVHELEQIETGGQRITLEVHMADRLAGGQGAQAAAAGPAEPDLVEGLQNRTDVFPSTPGARRTQAARDNRHASVIERQQADDRTGFAIWAHVQHQPRLVGDPSHSPFCAGFRGCCSSRREP
ncbi:MAG: hypothetical protein R3E86_07410 [Pseudomonadales bacterium]